MYFLAIWRPQNSNFSKIRQSYNNYDKENNYTFNSIFVKKTVIAKSVLKYSCYFIVSLNSFNRVGMSSF